MSHNINISRIRAVRDVIGKLNETVVFVGGATVSLYAERNTTEIRPTEDVDLLFEIWSRQQFEELEQNLRAIGFRNDMTSAFIGRYLMNEIIIDIMPISEEILGFSNRWYSMGFNTAVEYKIDDDHSIKILHPAYFLASKIEAFHNRGENDGRMSKDFEDIVFLLDNRSSIWEELKHCDKSLHLFVKQSFSTFLENPFFEEWLNAHLSFNSYDSSAYIIGQIKLLIQS